MFLVKLETEKNVKDLFSGLLYIDHNDSYFRYFGREDGKAYKGLFVHIYENRWFFAGYDRESGPNVPWITFDEWKLMGDVCG